MAFLLPEPDVMPGCDPLDPPPVSCLEGLSIERKVVAVDGHTVAAEMHLLERGEAGDSFGLMMLVLGIALVVREFSNIGGGGA